MRRYALLMVVLAFCGCSSNPSEGRYQHYDYKTGTLKDGPAWEDPEVLNYQPPTPPTIELVKDATHSEIPPESLQYKLPNGSVLDMVGIGRGSFVMGISIPRAGCFTWGAKTVEVENRMNLHIGHKVTLTRDFWIGRFEVSQQEYCAVMGQRQFVTADGRCPATGVNWLEAKRFCERLNELFDSQLPQGYVFDLPSEAQWEYACKAGTTTELNNGLNIETYDSDGYRLYVTNSPSIDLVAWYAGNSSGVVHQVGGKAPNQWGLYDMQGNVAEWCQDYACRYDETNYSDPLFIDQAVGPERWKQRILSRRVRTVRGGSFASSSYDISYAVGELGESVCSSLTIKPENVGFRVALVPTMRPKTLADLDKRVYGVSPYEIKCRLVGKSQAHKTRQYLARKNELRWNVFLKSLELAVLAGETAVNVYATVDEIKHGKPRPSAAGNDESSGDSWGTIKGPENIVRGKTAVYELYVGGKKITSGVSWEQAGTSITVSNCGNFARVLAGEPPIKYGSFKTKIRAVYNGKTYTKNLQIKK